MRPDEVNMSLLEFLGTMVFVAAVLLSMVAVLDIFFPRLIPVARDERSSGLSRARKFARANARGR
jgi:hypothetical protein